ncbi:MAG: hypothetical protein FH762_09740 [Firmicutes bacterium]|nr:hypothetical protein [Bacillota bacterium]
MFSKKIRLNIFSVLILILFVLLATGSSSEDDATNGPDKHGARVMAQLFLEDNLKAPSTADYPFWSEDIDEVVTELGNNKYRFRSYVDSENSFGAKVRTNFNIVVQYIGDDEWHLISMDTW